MRANHQHAPLYEHHSSIQISSKTTNHSPVCPSCSNLLTITPIPADHLPLNEQHFANVNRFECRTCPYQMILDKRYYERKMMKSKEVEDVLGGADSWKNVDKTEGIFLRLIQILGAMTTDDAAKTVNCREEKCDNREAYFRQVQIRSADEPMTTFYKVCFFFSFSETLVVFSANHPWKSSVQSVLPNGARTECSCFFFFFFLNLQRMDAQAICILSIATFLPF